MERKAVLSQAYHGFEDEVYTLVVGHQSRRFNVLADILNQIPRFSNLIKEGTIKQDVPYIMKDCSPVGVSIVLAFLRGGKVPDLGSNERTLSLKGELSRKIKAYQYALDIELESAQNAILDQVYPVLAKASPNDLAYAFCSEITQNFQNSPSFYILTQQAAYLFQDKEVEASFHQECNTMTDIVGQWEKEAVVAIMVHLSYYISMSPAEAAMRNPCQFHNHFETELCVLAEPEGQESVADLAAEEKDYIEEGNTGGSKEKTEDLQFEKGAQDIVQEEVVDAGTSSSDAQDANLMLHLEVSVRADADRQAESQDSTSRGNVSELCPDSNAEQDSMFAEEVAYTDSMFEAGAEREKEQDFDDESWEMASNRSFPEMPTFGPAFETSRFSPEAQEEMEQPMSQVEEGISDREESFVDSPLKAAPGPLKDICEAPLEDGFMSGRDTRAYHRHKRAAKEARTPMMRVDKYGNLR